MWLRQKSETKEFCTVFFFGTVLVNHSATQDVYIRWGQHTGKQ